MLHKPNWIFIPLFIVYSIIVSYTFMFFSSGWTGLGLLLGNAIFHGGILIILGILFGYKYYIGKTDMYYSYKMLFFILLFLVFALLFTTGDCSDGPSRYFNFIEKVTYGIGKLCNPLNENIPLPPRNVLDMRFYIAYFTYIGSILLSFFSFKFYKRMEN